MPASMIYTPMSSPLDGGSYRVLSWILWEAHYNDRWPRLEDEPGDLLVRYCGNAMRDGAGLDREKGYAGVRNALQTLTRIRFLVPGSTPAGSAGNLIADAIECPGPHFDVRLPADLSAANWRPLSHYALLNLDHIRRLRQPLDFAIYARACHVARAGQPQFEIGLAEIASISGTKQQPGWAALRRLFLGSCARVAAAVDGRFVIQAWCGGDHHGADRFLVRVGRPGLAMNTRFRPRHRAYFFEVDPSGHRRFIPPKATRREGLA